MKSKLIAMLEEIHYSCDADIDAYADEILTMFGGKANAELIAMAPELYGLAKSIVWAENDDDIRLAKRLAKDIIAKIGGNV